MTKAETLARSLLRKAQVQAPPIPIEDIAKSTGAHLRFEPFEGDISGMVYRNEEKNIIGVNSFHTYTRQRFTIAHELGHLLFHGHRELILDRAVQVKRRDEVSGMGTDDEEVEANSFAAELLMPHEFVSRELKRILARNEAPSEDALIEELANQFKVSPQAMGFRLTNLGFYFPR